jgi:hypothetical protein
MRIKNLSTQINLGNEDEVIVLATFMMKAKKLIGRTESYLVMKKKKVETLPVDGFELRGIVLMRQN